MNVLKLKNGAEEAEPLVRVTMMSLESLMRDHPIHFYELVMLCRDRTHVPFGNTAELLRGRAMIADNNFVHNSIRNIVLSSVSGDGLEMVLDNPAATEAAV